MLSGKLFLNHEIDYIFKQNWRFQLTTKRNTINIQIVFVSVTLFTHFTPMFHFNIIHPGNVRKPLVFITVFNFVITFWKCLMFCIFTGVPVTGFI